MDISKFDYKLPKSLIAQSPASPRDSSKLLLVDRLNQSFTHHRFRNISSLLTSSDVLVLNKTKVIPARIFGHKRTGGKIELLLLKQIDKYTWSSMIRGKIKLGDQIEFPNMRAKIIDIQSNVATLKFNKDPRSFIKNSGNTPLPPYIKSENEQANRKNYQTVYAQKEGSVAAPTAGLHFTKSLLRKLSSKGVKVEFVTLHVGLGTFAPLRGRDITKHNIHSEYFELKGDVSDRLNKYKKAGKRIISVGTTSTRVLETCADIKGTLHPHKGETKIYIYPPFRFNFVDGLLTNFHLPKSTLLALVSAFVTEPNSKEVFVDFKSSLVGRAYDEAISKNYRFYSYGDTMLIV